MSLDVYLTTENEIPSQGPKIFIREDGRNKEISREEWDNKFPGQEPITMTPQATNEVYSYNITHNLGDMARDAGLYYYLWRPEEIGITKAHQLIGPLALGIERLKMEPDRFKKFNPENGWGDYEGLVEFVESYLQACREYPNADIDTWR